MGRGALHHGDVRAVFPQVRADVVRGIVGADHDRRLAPVALAALVPAGMVALARETVHAGIGGHVGDARHPRGQHELPGPQGQALAIAEDLDDPFRPSLVVAGRRALGLGPVVQLHDLRVVFQPVGHLVLGGEDRPVVGKGEVGKVVVPDGIVQVQGPVTLAPLVAGPLVLVDDERRDAEPLEPRAERDAALSAADHQAVGLARAAEFGLLLAPLVRPGAAALLDAVLDALFAARAALLLETLELPRCRQKRPGLVAPEPQMTLAPRRRRLERDPRIDDAAAFARRFFERPGGRLERRQLRLQHRFDGRAAFEGLDIPGEGDQVAPEAILHEQGRRGRRVAGRKGMPEPVEPGMNAFVGLREARGLLGDRRHGHPPRTAVFRELRRFRGGCRDPKRPGGGRLLEPARVVHMGDERIGRLSLVR